MDELDLLDALSRRSAKESAELLQKLKTAAVRDSVKNTIKAVGEWAKEHAKKSVQWARDNKGEIAGSAIGATAGGAGTYVGHRKNKKTGKSPSQSVSDAAVKKVGKHNKKDSYAKGVSKTVAKSSKDYNDVAAKHPRAAAVTEGLALGAPAGAFIARKLMKKK